MDPRILGSQDPLPWRYARQSLYKLEDHGEGKNKNSISRIQSYLLVKIARFPPLCGGGDPPIDDSDMDESMTI